MMKKIVIIGANEFQNPLILKAKEMGYETHVFAWQDGSVGEKTADFFYPISIVEKDLILEKCREISPDAVCTIASDLANITVQYVAEGLGLMANSRECIELSTNKYKMRCALNSSGVPTPFFTTASSAEDLKKHYPLNFPMIVKPVDRSGSRGITKVFSDRELERAVKVSVEYSFEKLAIVEEYIEGPEYSCECISSYGEHHMLAITEKFTTGAPHFIETGHIEPAPLSPNMTEKVRKCVFSALDALKIKHGASHSEFKITPDGAVKIIEIGSRMGGDCIGSSLVRLSTGYDFVAMVIETALGDKPMFSSHKSAKYAAIRFVFDKEDIEVLERIKKNFPKAIYFESPIETVGTRKIVDSGSRLGFYIMTADSYEEILKISELKNEYNPSKK